MVLISCQLALKNCYLCEDFEPKKPKTTFHDKLAMKSSVAMQKTSQLEYINSNGLKMKIILYFVWISQASESTFSQTKNASTPQHNNADNEKTAISERSMSENS